MVFNWYHTERWPVLFLYMKLYSKKVQQYYKAVDNNNKKEGQKTTI